MGSNQDNRDREEVVKSLTHGRRFVEELLRENERLRYKLLHLEQEMARAGGNGAPPEDLAEENRRLREQLDLISSRFDRLARENEDFLERHLDVEKQNENLVNLYVSGFQLHSTLQQEGVLAVIHEILLNLVGAEVFTIWMVDQETGGLTLVSRIDEDGCLPPSLPAPSREVIDQLSAGRNWTREDGECAPPAQGDPILCVPLQLEGRTVGILCIYKLLVQKKGISALDQELLGLLAAQSVAALLGSRLFAAAGRELRAID
jgi:hypothetical protein